MHHYLERLEEQQKLVLELITGKKQALLEQYANKGPSVNKVRYVATLIGWARCCLDWDPVSSTRMGVSDQGNFE
jgi:hypothetical protein